MIEILGAYLLLLYTDRKRVGWVITAFAFGTLIIAHVERMLTDYGGWHLGIATSLMIECIHLCSFGWDYADGGADPSTLATEQKANAIKDLPSLLEFFSAALCPTQSFAGPSSNFVDFKNYIYSQGIYENIPSTVAPCLVNFAAGSLFIAIYVLCLKYFPLSFLESHDFLNVNFFTRVIYKSSNFILAWHLINYCTWH